MALSAGLRRPLRIAHYPPYTSKWHPIEHRLFSHVERALRGVMLDSHETALKAVQRTPHSKGIAGPSPSTREGLRHRTQMLRMRQRLNQRRHQ